MLVLWVIVVLGAVGAGVAAAARGQTRLVETVRARTVARYAAESGVVAAKARLEEMFRAAETPEEQARVFGRFEEEIKEWGELTVAGARYQVAVTDLGARVDLNNSDEEIILALFEEFLGESDGASLVSALQDWIDEDDERLPDGAEARDYARAGSPFRPTNRPLLRLDELTRIRGFSDSVAAVLAPYVTVWGDGLVNVNTASRPVLAAMPEIGPDAAEYVASAREQGEVMVNTAAVWREIVDRSGGSMVPQLTEVSTVPGHVLIVSRGWEANRPLTHEVQAVIVVEGLMLPGGPRLWIKHWAERDL
jgi:general secretion pathway protein K